MDDLKTQNEIPEYAKTLPKAVQDLVFDGEWEKRTLEIAKKYSLNGAQIDSLANTVVLVLIGLESPDTFLQTMVTDLGISRLLAEQIMADLETRVFEYALGRIEKVENREQRGEKEEQKIEKVSTQISNLKSPISTPQVPEIKPVTLPMVEKDEPVRVVPPPQTENQNVVINKPQQEQKPQEKVQQPVPVPRFTSTPMQNVEISKVRPLETQPPRSDLGTQPVPPPAPPIVQPQTPQNIMDAKLNSVVRGAKDPYREALE